MQGNVLVRSEKIMEIAGVRKREGDGEVSSTTWFGEKIWQLPRKVNSILKGLFSFSAGTQNKSGRTAV